MRILTWGGLRGALSVAMALSLPQEVDGTTVPERGVILVMTYIVVVFSILVQGLTMAPFRAAWLAAGGAAEKRRAPPSLREGTAPENSGYGFLPNNPALRRRTDRAVIATTSGPD